MDSLRQNESDKEMSLSKTIVTPTNDLSADQQGKRPESVCPDCHSGMVPQGGLFGHGGSSP